MFESLQQGLTSALKTIRGHAKLTEANMRDGLRLVRQALLEADVSLPAVKDFMARVSEQALGEKVLASLKPDQQLIGIVHQELINLMGPVDHSLHLQGDVTILMLCGLQGSGKTTTCGKLGRLINERGKKPLLVAADLQRPAAIHQLEVLGEQLGLAVYSDRNETNPVKVCNDAVKHARQIGADVVILDTAGRLHIDSELMAQLERIDRQCNPEQIYLVVDAMTGQDAVNSAKAFNDALELDGVIMTKLDGDARGGAALSVKAVADVPIKFIGTGEHMDALEEFHPDRMAGRILGMGDVLTLVEQAQQKFDQEEMTRQQARLEKGEFTLDDLKKMFNQIKRLGSLGKIMGMIPGMGQMAEMVDGAESEKGMRRMLGVIDSMTPDERRNPRKTIDQSRRRRIAAGAGVEPSEVNELVKTFDAMAGHMKAAGGKGRHAQAKAMQELVKEGMLNPGGKFSKKKQGTGKRLSSQEKAKLKKVREREKRRKKRQTKK
ncbi:MAG: signal recognition particle protein [Pirellulaceae bacterium]|nr:signal recognition particle protein [Pirellulaceae bacterium]